MRRLMWLTLGFGLACGLRAWGWTVPGWLMLAGAALWAGVGIKMPAFLKMAVLFLGCALGLFWCSYYGQTRLAPAAAMEGRTEDVSIRISDYGYETSYGTAADGTVSLDGASYVLRVYLQESRDLSPGKLLQGPFRFRLTTPQGADTYHAGKGMFLLAYQAGDVEILDSPAPSWRDSPARLRRHLLEILDACFPEDAAPFAKALLLGDTSDLSYQVDSSFKISGIRHVVAVSGLHVSILFALLSAVTFHRRFWMGAVALPALALFAAVCGFTPSVNRACMMAALMVLSQVANREYDGPTALSFAALWMLVWNPLVITSVSFQLSVASVAGIYLFMPAIYGWLTARKQGKRLAFQWFATSVSISLSVMVMTTPLCAVYFGTVSLIGVLTNLLTLWLISLIFYGCMAVCLLGQFWVTGGMILAKIVAIPIRFILFTAKILSQFPLAAVYTASPYITGWLVFVYVLLAAFVLMRKKQPVVLGCCAALGLSVALLASWLEPMLDDARLTVLDVGQGQCILLEAGGRTYMVDCGGDSDTRTADLAAQTLLSRGVTRLDGLILTHMDRDHAGAAENLLSRVDTDVLVLPDTAGEEGFSTGADTVYASDNLQFTFDGGVLTVFAAQYPGTGNEKSLAVLFDTEKCDILITGDRNAFGERMLLRTGSVPKVDVLIAGHHGSKHSTCDALLEAAAPEVVCISAAADNPYGHPAPELLERLEKAGCQIYRTDQHGTILIRR